MGIPGIRRFAGTGLNMTEDWRHEFRKALADSTLGLTMKSISLQARLSHSALYDILVKGQDPSISNFIALANAAGLSPGRLLDEKFGLKVPIIGVVASTEHWTPSAPQQSLQFDIGDHDVIGLEVRGDAMYPVYRDGDVLICHRRHGQFAHDLIGLDCAVQTVGGSTYVKILKPGSKPGAFNLKSYSPHIDDIEDVTLEWAASIAWVRRGPH